MFQGLRKQKSENYTISKGGLGGILAQCINSVLCYVELCIGVYVGAIQFSSAFRYVRLFD